MPSAKLHVPTSAMRNAHSYAEWRDAALDADVRSGAADWRDDERTDLIDVALMRGHIDALAAAVRSGDPVSLRRVLYESLYRHMGDIGNPRLYDYAFGGTKHVIEEYLVAAERAVEVLAGTPYPGLDEGQRREDLARAAFNLGQPALLLSGGASMGFVHLGVAKALFEQGLLPKVISGSSLGSLVAAGIASRTPTELAELMANTDSIYRYGIKFLSPGGVWARGAVLDNHQLLRCARHNIGDFTFAEAHARSGRVLGISVSPSRARQKPRLLSYLTSPEVLLPRAALASCAIPGLFPSVQLRARGAQGRHAYLPQESWVDGTFQGDLPMKRLGRLFNVNLFIVSQANPHSVPFLVSRHGRGWGPTLADAALSSTRAQLGALLKVARERVRQPLLHNVVEHAYALTEQSYRGDVNIHPPLSPWLYRRLLSNPTPADLRRYTLIGEQAAWPKIGLIHNLTRISRLVHEAAGDKEH